MVCTAPSMSFRRQKAHFSTKCCKRAWPEIEFIIWWCCGKGAAHSNFKKTWFDSGKWSCAVNTVLTLFGAILILTVLCWFWLLCTSPSQGSVSDCHTSLRPKSQSGVANLDLDLPSKGLVNCCSQIEELRVKYNSKGELLECTCASNATQCNQVRDRPHLCILSYVIIPCA